MSQNSNFRLPRGHRFFAKNGSYIYSAKSRSGLPRVHLGANGVPLGKKMGQNRKKLPCSKIRIFDYPAVIDFSQKMEVSVIAPNHGGDPLGSILGPMGSHWVKKWVKTVKNYHAPKFELSTTHWFFWKNGSYGSGAKSRWGPPRVHLGAHGSKKWVNTVKITMPQNSNFRLPRGHRFFAKNGSYIYSAKSRSGLPRVHLGANGVPLGPKKWVKTGKLPCPKIRIFDDPSVIDFSQKMEVTFIAPNQGRDSLGSILGPMGSHWVKKWVKTVKNYHARKFEFSTTPRSSIFPKKWKFRL